MRVSVVRTSGSGKSTFAARLAAATGFGPRRTRPAEPQSGLVRPQQTDAGNLRSQRRECDGRSRLDDSGRATWSGWTCPRRRSCARLSRARSAGRSPAAAARTGGGCLPRSHDPLGLDHQSPAAEGVPGARESTTVRIPDRAVQTRPLKSLCHSRNPLARGRTRMSAARYSHSIILNHSNALIFQCKFFCRQSKPDQRAVKFLRF